MTDVLEGQDEPQAPQKGLDMPCAGCAEQAAAATIPVWVHQELVALHDEVVDLRSRDSGPPAVVKVLLVLYVVAVAIAVLKMFGDDEDQDQGAKTRGPRPVR